MIARRHVFLCVHGRKIKEIYYYHTNHAGIMSKDLIHHKFAHPADNARPTVLSNAINFVTLVYLLCTQQAAC